MPTFAEIIHGTVGQTDGISFYNELMGKPQKKHEFLYWEYPERGGQKAIRMGKWKGLWRSVKDGNSHIELYNLETDPREQFDCSSQYPQIIATIRRLFETERSVSPNPLFEF